MSPTVIVDGCSVNGTSQPATSQYPVPIDIFYGIPYARTARFRPAVLTAFLSGTVLTANKVGTAQPFFMAPHSTAENPLTLNVFRPSNISPEMRLPVVIYFHGGAFNFGNPLERDLASFVSWTASTGSPIVVVSISYRLGALGFLSGGEEAKELNLGLKDQVVAMEWVKRYIAPFGGDPTNATAMGTSAGAHSIGHHILRPSPSPFTKAILESGSPTARSVLSPSHPRTITSYKSLHAHTARRPAPLTTTPLAPILEASITVWVENAGNVTWPFQPVIEPPSPTAIIPDTPLNLWRNFSSSHSSNSSLSIITGFNSHEGTQFVPDKASTNAEFRSFFATLIPSLTPTDLDTLEHLYPDPIAHPNTTPYMLPQTARQGDQFHRLHAAYAHYAYICPVLHTAHMLSTINPHANIYVYEFAALSEPFRASSHGDQARVVAHEASLSQAGPGLIEVADEMSLRWGKFAASPDGKLAEDLWPRFVTPFEHSPSNSDFKLKTGADAVGTGKILVFGDGNDEANGGRDYGTPVKTRTLTDYEIKQCQFWWERMHLSQGMGQPTT